MGSSPTWGTMVKFKYNGQIYAPSNLEKKLKKMGITIDDIELIEEDKKPKEVKPFTPEWYELNGWLFMGMEDNKGRYVKLISVGDKEYNNIKNNKNVFRKYSEYVEWYHNR